MRNRSPGKFQACDDDRIGRALYSLDADESAGELDEHSEAHWLYVGKRPGKRSYILSEDSNGFVTYTTHESEDDARRVWARIEALFRPLSDDIADAVSDVRYSGRASEWYEREDGNAFRVRIEYEEGATDAFTEYDCYGRIEWVTRTDPWGRYPRPAGFDGAARIIHRDRGVVWWQPPADIKNDAKALAQAEQRARGWFNDDWHYVYVVVEVMRPPCDCCGTRKPDSASLGMVESDSGAEYFREVVGELLTELGIAVAADARVAA